MDIEPIFKFIVSDPDPYVLYLSLLEPDLVLKEKNEKKLFSTFYQLKSTLQSDIIRSYC